MSLVTLPGLIARPAPDHVAATAQELDFWRHLNLSLDKLLDLGASERQERQDALRRGALDRIAAAMPPTLPPEDILHAPFNWPRALYAHDLDSAQEREAHQTLAQRYGRTSAELPKVRNGPFPI